MLNLCYNETMAKRKRSIANADTIIIKGTMQKHRKGFGFVAPIFENGTERHTPGENRLQDRDVAGFAEEEMLKSLLGTDEAGNCRDLFVSGRHMAGAMDGDVVEVEVLPEYMWGGFSGGYVVRDPDSPPPRPEGRVVGVMKRALTEVAGTFMPITSGRGRHAGKKSRFAFVRPEGSKLPDNVLVRGGDFGGAEAGDRVMVKITRYPDRSESAEGKVTEIIARANEPAGDIRLIARSFGMQETFPSKVKREAAETRGKACAEEQSAEGAGGAALTEELKGRRDLRAETIFTIDGPDSKDFDDAVSIGKLDNGNWLLGVHIADVTHYVKEGGPIDREALKRGTSVYLLDVVIPMLPRVLSNDLCSLQPGKDRLTLSVDMEISPEGEVVGHEIYESVINSKARLVYDDVSDLLEGFKPTVADIADGNIGQGYYDGVDRLAPDPNAVIAGDYMQIESALFEMQNLAETLNAARRQRGSIDFDLDESRIELNDKGMPVSVEIAERRCANRLIEEFMLLANETIAEHFYWLDIPFIYRVHEKPDFAKMERLKMFLASFGIPFRSSTDSVHPKTIANLLEKVSGTTYENVISSVALRSMQKAYYGTSCDGHFGLALKYYTHFTSPIRRYPDLQIHRIIKSVIADGPTDKLNKHYRGIIDEVADLSSAAERRAVEAEREVEKLKKVQYMATHIGEEFDGIISGITSFGFFVELENTVEGLVRIDELFDDYYDFHPDQYALIGQHTGNRYCLGDRVMVAVESVDTEQREINFVLM